MDYKLDNGKWKWDRVIELFVRWDSVINKVNWWMDKKGELKVWYSW